jgi:hypothetical protein
MVSKTLDISHQKTEVPGRSERNQLTVLREILVYNTGKGNQAKLGTV